MRVIWSPESLDDVTRLYRFLAAYDVDAALKAKAGLQTAPIKLRDYPRLGERLETYDPREVRKLGVGNYHMRYELLPDVIYILRIWHAREDYASADAP